jgi:hypothetical protein
MSLALASAVISCSDSRSREPAQEPEMDASTAREAAAERRVKERTVSIELFPIAHRELIEGADGAVSFAPFTPIGGARVCLARRRAAFALFERFEEVAPDERICATSEEEKAVRLSGLPANSDLVLTVTKEGYVPATFTFRTDEHDVELPQFWSAYMTMMRLENRDRWLEPEPVPHADDSRVGIAVNFGAIFYPGEIPPLGAEQAAAVAQVGFTHSEGATVRIEPTGSSEEFVVMTRRERPAFVSLPEGSYRVIADDPRAGACIPISVGDRFLPWGLPADQPNVLELPALAGHTAVAAFYCPCDYGPDERLVDLATCAVEPISDPTP